MKRFLPFILYIFVHSSIIAQEGLDPNLKGIISKLDSVDRESISTGFFLNRGFLSNELIADFLEFQQHEEDNFILNDRQQWRRIYRGLKKSTIGNRQKFNSIDFKALKEKYGSRKNVVPIGVMQVRGEWLEQEEIEDNVRAKADGRTVTAEYPKLDIFNASILIENVYSGSVSFEIAPEAFYVKNEKRIKSLSVDLADGKGFRKIGMGDIIFTTYESIGEKVIGVKFDLADKSFVSYSTLNIVTLDDENPSQVFQIDGTSGGKTASTAKIGLTGGAAYLYAGCDGVFDRPVIIVEGLDANNDVPLEDIRAKYTRGNIEQAFRANGRDVVYLNFSNGGADIRTNAVVLQSLIQDINRQKIGTAPLIVIGESMGGLVARYAIRKMEQSNITHNISHYVSFDSPHKGANVPVGYQKMLESIDEINFREIFNIGQDDIDEANTLLNSKAAKQMLLRYRGPDPHADFTSLQNEFNSLGFPQKGGIRNISIVNGALDGSRDEPGIQYGNGSRLIEADANLAGLVAAQARIRTNTVNSNGRVSSLYIFTGGLPTTIKEMSYNFNAFNYDLSAGGLEDNRSAASSIKTEIIVLLRLFGIFLDVTDYGNSNFSFVPLFSSTASTAPRSSQQDLNRSAAQLTASSWTPFNRILGSNENTKHVETRVFATSNLGWRNLFDQELGLPFVTACNVGTANATPPAPIVNGRFFYMCELNSETLYVDNPAAIAGLYVHNWNVTGPVNFSGNGNQITMYRGLKPGVYTVRATRTFNTSTGLRSGSSSGSKGFTVFSQYDRRYGCSSGGGGAIPLLANIKAPETNKSLEKTDQIDSNSVLTWPNPVKDELNIEYSMVADENVVITLLPLNYQVGEILVVDAFRSSGMYRESITGLSLENGIYVMTIRTGTQTVQKKIIVNN